MNKMVLFNYYLRIICIRIMDFMKKWLYIKNVDTTIKDI